MYCTRVCCLAAWPLRKKFESPPSLQKRGGFARLPRGTSSPDAWCTVWRHLVLIPHCYGGRTQARPQLFLTPRISREAFALCRTCEAVLCVSVSVAVSVAGLDGDTVALRVRRAVWLAVPVGCALWLTVADGDARLREWLCVPLDVAVAVGEPDAAAVTLRAPASPLPSPMAPAVPSWGWSLSSP
jgi:hypothetical protein